MARKPKTPKQVTSLSHGGAKRTNIPTAEYQPVMEKADTQPVKVNYPREVQGLQEEKESRNRDLDPQLVWRGKDQQDWSDLVVDAPPLYIQEKVKPKVLIDDLLNESKKSEPAEPVMGDLFGDFNGLPEGADKTDFYQYQGNWQNRMILGDSLKVMASLAEREGLRGKVQCIYLDPPYGIKFNSNFQWSTTDRSGTNNDSTDKISREPEQVKAFRDTWRDGIHSYLTYLRDRLTVARDLLTESGSIFVQIGDENVHRVRAVMDEVFGSENAVIEIVVKKKGSQKSSLLDPVNDYILWYSKFPRHHGVTKFRPLFEARSLDSETIDEFSRVELPTGETANLKRYVAADGETLDFRAYPRRIEEEFPEAKLFRPWPITNGGERANQMAPINFEGQLIHPPKGRCWSHTSLPPEQGLSGMTRNLVSGRLVRTRSALDFKRYLEDFPFKGVSNWWDGFGGASDQVYVVQTNERVIERCILMATDPGDLVLDPTCGSGTTAYVAEQWGRRWITLDTSRVALALARARIMGARYAYYLLADSKEGQKKEAEVTRSVAKNTPTYGNIMHGFVYHRYAYITSGVVANDAEIDVIWDKFEAELAPLRKQLTEVLPKGWLVAYRKQKKYTAEVPPEITEWEVPREPPADWSKDAKVQVAEFWQLRIARQREIDASIAAKADFEYLYDKPYQDNKKVRVAGPFTVESLSPHRVLGVDENDELIDAAGDSATGEGSEQGFVAMVLDNLKTAGVQQAHKDGRIAFEMIAPWPGELICAEGRYQEGDKPRRAGLFIGPEFGTVTRQDLVLAAREAADADFDVLIACAFSYEAHATEFDKLGRIPVLKARMNADLHMAEDLKNTGKGNLFVIFGEPDIDILDGGDGQIRVKVNGVDVFKPQTGEVVSDGPDGIACWFIDTDYDEESFFVRHAYFLGANDPYKSLKTTLKAEINRDAWDTLHSDTSRPFPKPDTGRIAVKVINHLGDEVMKVFKV